MSLKPILLSYHSGELQFDWKTPFLSRIVELKIVRTQDINWDELLELFPNQTAYSMGVYLKNTLKRNSREQPIFERLQEIIPNLKNVPTRGSLAKHREKVVFLYDKIKGLN